MIDQTSLERQIGNIFEQKLYLTIPAADSDLFEAKFVPVGSRSEPPYEVIVQVPDTEHRIVTVRVTDDRGETSDASTHVHVGTHRGASAK